MRALACLVFITLAYAIQGSPYVVGGKEAPIAKFPYQASLRINGTHKCSGSILSNVNVLTAAYCVKGLEKDSLKNLKIHVGTNFLNESGYVFDVENVNININYDDYLLGNDIALIYLKSPIMFNKLVQPINLTTSNENFENKPVKFSGWGSKVVGGNISNALQEIDLTVNSLKTCGQVHWRVTDTNICTSIEQGKGVCDGDRGSPLVYNGSQIGIFSYGKFCAPGSLDVYTRISSFRVWITANLKHFQCL